MNPVRNYILAGHKTDISNGVNVDLGDCKSIKIFYLCASANFTTPAYLFLNSRKILNAKVGIKGHPQDSVLSQLQLVNKGLT